MPIFDYECSTCNFKEEKIVKNSDVIVNCSECSGVMKKLVSTPSFVLKGQGFFSSGSFPKSRTSGPHISKEILEMPDVELNRSLGLPDDH